MTLRSTLAMVRELRRADDDTPYVLMGYYNPIYRYGAEAFARDAVAAGVDGAIVVDLPPEEDAGAGRAGARRRARLRPARHPDQRRARLPAIVEHASGFIYYVAIAGITGTRSADAAERRRRGRPAAPLHQFADRGRLRHQDPGAGRRSGARRRRRGGRLGARRSPRPQPRPGRQRQARPRRRRPRRRARPGRRGARRPAGHELADQFRPAEDPARSGARRCRTICGRNVPSASRCCSIASWRPIWRSAAIAGIISASAARPG